MSTDKSQDEKAVRDSLQIVSGRIVKDKTTLFSIMRDEMFFIEAFFSYYRSIGITQFVIFDDKSNDGTQEFLKAQADCVVITSEYRFGDPIIILDHNGAKKRTRAGPYFKKIVPNLFLEGQYVLFVDADEFLFLPPNATSVDQIIDRLAKAGEACIAASVVEFFPKNLSGLETTNIPKSFEELLADYPLFESDQILELRKGKRPARVGISKSGHLFIKHRIKLPPYGLSWLPPFITRLLPFKSRQSPRIKTPILHQSPETYLVGSHNANVPPTEDGLLTIAHFVFSAQFTKKITRARKWRSYAQGSQKYDQYMLLHQEMKKRDPSFIGETTMRFENVDQLIDAGLMKW